LRFENRDFAKLKLRVCLDMQYFQYRDIAFIAILVPKLQYSGGWFLPSGFFTEVT
jgi:hypothetical protein